MRTTVSWTGGKDCNLALMRAQEDPRYDVVQLVIFHPADPKFEAHPLEISKLQGEALGLPIRYVQVGAEPSYKESYIQGMKSLMADDGIEAIVTGDIDYVGTMTRNWVEECAEGAGMHCWLPLWQASRREMILEILDRKLHIVLSCVKAPWFGPEDIGRTLDQALLLEFERKEVASGLDVSGEKGEYHTMCLDGPLYRQRVALEDRQAKELHNRAGQADQRWWVLQAVTSLEPKQ